jgi:hypothetical protein
MDGVDLSVLLEGKQPPKRDHISTAFNNFVWIRNERYALICRNDGTEPKLYDLQVDPKQDKDIASQHPEIVKRLFELVVKDAGGELYRLTICADQWKIGIGTEGCSNSFPAYRH